jgi:hypothetical protein
MAIISIDVSLITISNLENTLLLLSQTCFPAPQKGKALTHCCVGPNLGEGVVDPKGA